MPKINIVVTERVTYQREVKMTEAEFREWDRKLDQRGEPYDRALEELTSKYIRRDDRDYLDADELDLSDFSLVLET